MAVSEFMRNSGVCDDNIVEALDELEVASATIKLQSTNQYNFLKKECHPYCLVLCLVSFF